MAVSNSFTVTSSVAINASPTSISSGSILTATWSGIPSPTVLDWIGLYAPGTADTSYPTLSDVRVHHRVCKRDGAVVNSGEFTFWILRVVSLFTTLFCSDGCQQLVYCHLQRGHQCQSHVYFLR